MRLDLDIAVSDWLARLEGMPVSTISKVTLASSNRARNGLGLRVSDVNVPVRGVRHGFCVPRAGRSNREAACTTGTGRLSVAVVRIVATPRCTG